MAYVSIVELSYVLKIQPMAAAATRRSSRGAYRRWERTKLPISSRIRSELSCCDYVSISILQIVPGFRQRRLLHVWPLGDDCHGVRGWPRRTIAVRTWLPHRRLRLLVERQRLGETLTGSSLSHNKASQYLNPMSTVKKQWRALAVYCVVVVFFKIALQVRLFYLNKKIRRYVACSFPAVLSSHCSRIRELLHRGRCAFLRSSSPLHASTRARSRR